jgi:periplasmic protein TonB
MHEERGVEATRAGPAAVRPAAASRSEHRILVRALAVSLLVHAAAAAVYGGYRLGTPGDSPARAEQAGQGGSWVTLSIRGAKGGDGTGSIPEATAESPGATSGESVEVSPAPDRVAASATAQQEAVLATAVPEPELEPEPSPAPPNAPVVPPASGAFAARVVQAAPAIGDALSEAGRAVEEFVVDSIEASARLQASGRSIASANASSASVAATIGSPSGTASSSSASGEVLAAAARASQAGDVEPATEGGGGGGVGRNPGQPGDGSGASAGPVAAGARASGAEGRNAPPEYPPAARRAGQQGDVTVLVHCSAAGTVEQASVETSSGFPLLDDAALHAVEGWTFEPAIDDGVAVAGWVRVPIRFVLRH